MHTLAEVCAQQVLLLGLISSQARTLVTCYNAAHGNMWKLIISSFNMTVAVKREVKT